MKSTSANKAGSMRGSRLRMFSFSILALTSGLASTGRAQDISDAVKAQISEILSVKDTFTPEEQKMSSALVFARRKALGLDIGQVAKDLTPTLGASEFARVEVRGKVKNRLKNLVTTNLGGQVASFTKTKGINKGLIVANVSLDSLTLLASNPDVASVRVATPRYNNVGSLNTQGIIGHQAKTVYKGAAGYKGAGVKVGVISDSATADQVARLKASGDLNQDANVLPGYEGPAIADGGTDEGTAIMEIVQDMAPAATVEFATGFGDFAAAIRALRDDGCKVIIDDLGGPEGVFEDDDVALAVNDVTSTGTVYVSSAGNSGSVAHATSGCWEGDFNPASTPVTYKPPTGSGSTKSYVVHAFAAGQNYDGFKALGEPYQFVTWADPLYISTNDYDLFVTSANGLTLKGFSVDVQSPTKPGYAAEFLGTSAVITGGNYSNQKVGDRFVITHVSGAANLAMHFDVERGTLTTATTGATYGHNAGKNTVSVAATFWDSARTGTKPFTGGANNPCETFSSDGPRKMFYNPDGSLITPGLAPTFASGGGVLLNKPDVTGADGVSTTTSNANEAFLPFFGTSAAAPHIAGIAAEIISARAQNNLSVLLPSQIQQALIAGALDNEAPGFDPTGGYGVVNAPAAVAAALALPSTAPQP